MSGSKETLGFSSRTAAVLALRQKGMTTREIASRIGIEVKTVAALECSASRTHRHGTRNIATGVIGTIPLNVRQILRPHAARRALTVDQLIREIVAHVAHGDLVDAVLDDAEEIGR